MTNEPSLYNVEFETHKIAPTRLKFLRILTLNATHLRSGTNHTMKKKKSTHHQLLKVHEGEKLWPLERNETHTLSRQHENKRIVVYQHQSKFENQNTNIKASSKARN